MRKETLKLASQFKLIGAFWKPDARDSIMTGTLVSNEKQIRFTTAPVYERDPRPTAEMFDGPDTTMIPALHGFTGAGNSTLCQIVEERCPENTFHGSLRQSIASRTFRVLTLIEGMHIGGVDEKCLDSAKFTFTALSEFFPPAFTEEWNPETLVITAPHTLEIHTFPVSASRL